MFLFVSIALIACSPEPVETAVIIPTIDTAGTTDDGGCDVVEVNYDGEDAPIVGDSWTVWLKCDGALLMGPTVIAMDPLTFATLDGNVITFQEVGKGSVTVQTGSFSDTLAVTVEAK